MSTVIDTKDLRISIGGVDVEMATGEYKHGDKETFTVEGTALPSWWNRKQRRAWRSKNRRGR